MVLGSDVSDLRNVSLMKIRSQGGLPSRIPASYACHRQALHELHGRVAVLGTRPDSGEQPGTRRKLATRHRLWHVFCMSTTRVSSERTADATAGIAGPVSGNRLCRFEGKEYSTNEMDVS